MALEDALASQVRAITARDKEVCGYIIDAVQDVLKTCHEDQELARRISSGEAGLDSSDRLTDIVQKTTNRVLMAVDATNKSLTKLITTLVQTKVDVFDLVTTSAIVPPEYLPEEFGGGLVHVEYNRGVYIPGCTDIHTQQTPIDLSVTAPDVYSTTVQQKRTPVYNTQSAMRKQEQARNSERAAQNASE